MKARLSEEEKIFIICNYEGKSLGRISEHIHRSRSTIKSFYKKWQATKTIINKKPTLRNHMLSIILVAGFLPSPAITCPALPCPAKSSNF